MRCMALTASIALLAFGGTTSNAQQGPEAYSTMSPDGLRTGVIVSEADCARDAMAVWVTAPHADGTVEGGCIRYYAAGLAASNGGHRFSRQPDRSFLRQGRPAYPRDPRRRPTASRPWRR